MSAPAELVVLPELTLQGAWQMTVDHWLLKAVDAGVLGPVLRFYHWPWPCLSLGRHQYTYPARWDALAHQGHLELVRRPSGGSAVLHGGGLTYALVLPVTMTPAGAGVERYRFCCRWLQQVFGQLGHPLVFGQEPARPTSSNCFDRATAADLVDARDGAKRIGSAQRRSRHALLQHGEMVLRSPPSLLWQQVFGQAPPSGLPLRLSGLHNLQQLLRQALMEQLGLGQWRCRHLSPRTWTTMARLPMGECPAPPQGEDAMALSG
ncbi:MAG: lipoate--protein ligase family protein [Cyanobacteria bacterium MAG CAR3_bin_5]|nr:lipoate--protein ligase family protein [Cyanobacteria bacterium MAG CAR3_bin_5]